jgi:hypothetical protein
MIQISEASLSDMQAQMIAVNSVADGVGAITDLSY